LKQKFISLLLKVAVANSAKKQLKSSGATINTTFSQQWWAGGATVKVVQLQQRQRGASAINNPAYLYSVT